MIAVLLVYCGIVYQTLAIIGALRFRRRDAIANFSPPVSVLKPVRGRDAAFYEAIRSHAEQWYPEFEILFGVAEHDDPALEDIERLQREFPRVPIRAVNTANDAPNRKAGSLALLARHATHEFLLVNDGDIKVDSDYLARVMSFLQPAETGLVTCLYRGRGASLPAEAEAIGVAVEFAPSVLVARLLSSSGFALGATMAFRKRELEAIGGFEAIREFLADDYQLGARISRLGKNVILSDTVVETNLGAGSWADVWKHQVRWSRTLRVSRPGGYFGYGVTQTTFWCLIAALVGHPGVAIAGLIVRLAAAYFALRAIDPRRTLAFIAVPLRDLFGFAVWCAGLAGTEVEWRGIRFRLSPDGRIAPLP
ncbi:MAG TPA: bacteriohopanetetrol glucosamine biosynthesis glycosyltransferase HpnI [Bryobacteraceae bacterium]|nr:bacteriohopanetetrol glucosamine biosynthesis glycosyltransferase HpnI [Bryobacteraceae bacterium]